MEQANLKPWYFCEYDGCDKPKKGPRCLYCEEHSTLARREASRKANQIQDQNRKVIFRLILNTKFRRTKR